MAEPVETLPESIAAGAESESDPQADLLSTINTLRAEGASYDKIADELEKRRIPTISGRGKWRGPAVSKFLKERSA
jgi:hypothetical protein